MPKCYVTSLHTTICLGLGDLYSSSFMMMNDDVNVFTIIWLRMSISVYDSNTSKSLQFVTASSFDLDNGRLDSTESSHFIVEFGFLSATSSFGTSSGCQPMSFTVVFSTFSQTSPSSRFGNYNFVFGELLRTH